MRETVRATIAICTHNRAGVLAAAVEAAAPQAAALGAEVLVVDNASTDATADVLHGLAARLGERLRVVHEPRLGLSAARNRALLHAAGPVVAYLDDDAVPQPGWLAALLEPFARPAVAAAGGRIVLGFPDEAPPPWLPAELFSLLSAFDLGDAPRVLRYGRADYPYGANLAVRAEAARQLGGFSPVVGPRGGDPLVHDETDLCFRLERAGGVIAYAPGAVVVHRVGPERLTPSWLLRRASGGGRSAALFILRNRGVLRAVARIAWWYGRDLAAVPYRPAPPIDPARLLAECRRREALAYVGCLVRNLPRARHLARSARAAAPLAA